MAKSFAQLAPLAKKFFHPIHLGACLQDTMQNVTRVRDGSAPLEMFQFGLNAILVSSYAASRLSFGVEEPGKRGDRGGGKGMTFPSHS